LFCVANVKRFERLLINISLICIVINITKKNGIIHALKKLKSTIMKKIFLLFAIISFTVFQSCTGPEGPPGQPGLNGNAFEAEVFEVTRNLNASSNFSAFVPLNPSILPADVVLTYVLWEVDNGLPIWRLLPQTVQLDEGDLQYNYDFTRFDVNIFLSSADFPLTILGPQWTQNQTFRIVLIPGFFASAKMDYSNYDQVMLNLQLTESDVIKKQ
jgi:hypothetical protein